MKQLTLLLTLLASSAAAQSVTTYHNTANRHGAYTVPGLTLAAAAGMHLDTAFNASVTGVVMAQPLFWQPASGDGLVIVATESNEVDALDANSGALVWRAQLPAPAPLSALGCGNINPEGITGTPSIDPAKGVIYLDAVTDVAPAGVRHMLYALSVTTGAVLPHWPIDVEASLAAKGVTFQPTVQGQRGATLIFGGRFYVSYGGRSGDCGSYHGTLIEVEPASSGSTTPVIDAVWSTRDVRGGIWSQGGVASDGQYVYVTTGNTGGSSTYGDGESMVRLAQGLAHSTSPGNFYAPANWLTLDKEDADLGGTLAIPLNVPQAGHPLADELLGLGKDGNAYLVSRGSLGGIGGTATITPVSKSAIITAPAVYTAGNTTLAAFRNSSGLKCSGSSLSVLSVAPAASPAVHETWCAPLNGAGAPILTTIDGTNDPIFWIMGAQGDGMLHGFNALTGAVVFAGGSSGGLPNLQRFATILAANAHFYVAGSGAVFAFAFQ